MSTITFESCEKDDIPDFIGQWQGKNYEIIFTPSTDFTYIDRVGSPWTGEILLTVDGETETITELLTIGDGFFNKKEGYGFSIFLYYGGDAFIDYKAAQYNFNGGWSLNYLEGTFSINTTVVSNNNTNKTLTISGTLTAGKIECKKDVEYTINDRRHHFHNKLNVIALNQGKELLCIVDDVDVGFYGDGNWNKSGKNLVLNYILHDWYAENVSLEISNQVEYYISNNYELVFTEDIKDITNNAIVNDVCLCLDPGTLSQLRYRITFKEAECDFFSLKGAIPLEREEEQSYLLKKEYL